MGRETSGILLYNDEKRVLLQHRDSFARLEPNKWGFFGGGIKEGETKLQTVIRETFEELTYKLSNPKLIITVTRDDESVVNLFSEKYNEDQKIVLNEGQGYGWFGKEDLEDLDMVEEDKQILLEIFDTLFL